MAKVTHDRKEFADTPAIEIDSLVQGLLVGYQGNDGWKLGYLRGLRTRD